MALNLQYLKHGKALCGKAFANFVETFNHLVNFSVNLSGDNDTAGGSGHITVDRADPSHPIIRCSGCGKSNGGSGGGGGDDPDEPESPEDVDPYEDDEDYDPDDEQDPWYENPEDSPAPGDGEGGGGGGEGGGGGGGEGGGGGGCNDWSGDPVAAGGAGGGTPPGWSGDNCGSINDFSR